MFQPVQNNKVSDDHQELPLNVQLELLKQSKKAHQQIMETTLKIVRAKIKQYFDKMLHHFIGEFYYIFIGERYQTKIGYNLKFMKLNHLMYLNSSVSRLVEKMMKLMDTKKSTKFKNPKLIDCNEENPIQISKQIIKLTAEEDENSSLNPELADNVQEDLDSSIKEEIKQKRRPRIHFKRYCEKYRNHSIQNMRDVYCQRDHSTSGTQSQIVFNNFLIEHENKNEGRRADSHSKDAGHAESPDFAQTTRDQAEIIVAAAATEKMLHHLQHILRHSRSRGVLRAVRHGPILQVHPLRRHGVRERLRGLEARHEFSQHRDADDRSTGALGNDGHQAALRSPLQALQQLVQGHARVPHHLPELQLQDGLQVSHLQEDLRDGRGDAQSHQRDAPLGVRRDTIVFAEQRQRFEESTDQQSHSMQTAVAQQRDSRITLSSPTCLVLFVYLRINELKNVSGEDTAKWISDNPETSRISYENNIIEIVVKESNEDLVDGRFRQELQSTVIAGSSTENNGPKSVYTNFKRKSDTDIEAISSESQIKKRHTFKPLTADDIVLYQYENEKAPTMIARLAQTNNVVMEWKYDNIEDNCRCTLLFNKGKVAEGVGLTQKDAKVEACNAALKEMQKRYYTIKVTKNLTPTINLEEKSEPASDYINSDNIGSKMMKMMGWSGGGLGKKSQGMVEPVSSTLQQQVTREGLGLKVGTYNIGAFRKKCSEVLRNYVKDQITTDMVFSPCFTNEERHVIHLVAKQMGLKSQSYGPKTSRILTISRKILPHELVNQLLESGGSTEKYELIKPTELQSL
ncbi:unnamed protein product [Trichogramma brassicae]|uniref:NF-kappa-B-repressing factor n=1 Tax=Trichogramma brassicae TaxID=86971 RepID=A0A6H5I3I4_9HYME|nr:unnamed protein product [Trichogramma brassicae]